MHSISCHEPIITQLLKILVLKLCQDDKQEQSGIIASQIENTELELKAVLGRLK